MTAPPSRLGARLPRNSVWPGCSKPASISTDLWIGLVTIALARPCCANSAASRMASITAGAFLVSVMPGRGSAAQVTGRMPSVSAGRCIASSGADIPVIEISRPSWSANCDIRSGSSIRQTGRSASRSGPAKDFRVISAPMPAGSPGVIITGAVSLSAPLPPLMTVPDTR
ncbi:MAG: Uncharacterised protein [SAR116 cluster bacterium]|nr:MAG: Uncharacterised protein [SAR116 cluster bacterium]